MESMLSTDGLPPAAPLGPLMTVAEAANHARVSRRTIYNWAEKGLVEVCFTPSGSLRVVATSLVRESREPAVA